MVSKICGVALFSESCSSQPALRRAVPHSELPAAVPAKSQSARDGIGPHHPIGERRVADHEIEAPSQVAPRVVLAPHPRLGMHEARDTGSDRVVFDAGEAASSAQYLGQQSEEQAGAHARFQHPPAVKTQPFGGAPECADDRLRRVMGVLRGPLQGGWRGSKR
jgi:hypothetical protein